MKVLSKIHHLDAQKLYEVINKKIIDVTITSPPYFNLKDYGSKKQIGYGQSYAEYLQSLNNIFAQIYHVTKKSGTLWIIVDTYRDKSEVVPLPFDIVNSIRKVGWKLQDIIIWKKERTLPWSAKGQARSIFEYILLFSKSKDYKYYVDRVREIHSLKKWWVKYPERYNPRGKNLEEIWNFDIPIQGSWGDRYLEHFCPLPDELVERIIQLTTTENDVVLDPFAGSGTVPLQAFIQKRRYIGFEVNRIYIRKFESYLKKHGKEKRKQYENNNTNTYKMHRNFNLLILDLRVLKFGKMLEMECAKLGNKSISKILIEKLNSPPNKKFSLITAKYTVLVSTKNNAIKVKSLINRIVKIRPLSKFGIDEKISVISSENKFRSLLNGNKYFCYKKQRTHKYREVYEASGFNNDWLIISPIKVDINENDMG